LKKHPDIRSDRVCIAFDELIDVVRLLVAGVRVDEAWYLEAFPGLAGAISSGVFRSGKHHYIMHGYFENRVPVPPNSHNADLINFVELKRLVSVVPVRGHLRLDIGMDRFRDILSRVAHGVEIDTDWYLEQYPDAAASVRNREIPSAAAHYATKGYFENRWPFDMDVDEGWYRERYPDVAAEIARGTLRSARDHFKVAGYGQGRVPSLAWDRRRNMHSW
jgi:hypothetical protein